MFIFDAQFWAGAGERAVKTVAQAALAAFGTGAIGLLDVDWITVGSIAGMAGIASVLMSIGAHESAARHASKGE